MRIALVHNAYGRLSGEEVVVESLVRNLESHGHLVSRFERGSAEIDRMRWGRVRAFFSGLYNPASRRAFARFLAAHQPEVVHVHNLFPLISPSILLEARCQKIPLVMTLHNFRLLCPSGLLMRHSTLCHECLGGREYWCALRNCERSYPKSLGYALRTSLARRRRWFLDCVSHFICLTEFQRDLHLGQGFAPQRCSVIPNAVPAEFLNGPHKAPGTSDGFVGYVGRISPEKDLPTLFAAAQRLAHIPFKLAGSLARMSHLPQHAPANVEFVGQLNRAALQSFYLSMRLFVFTTRWYEGLPTVLLEAMAMGRPVVCTRIGGLPELVQDGVTGFLAPLGDPVQLAASIQRLWQSPELALQMGQAGHAKVLLDYHPDAVYARHMQVYHRVQTAAAVPLSCGI